METDAFKTIKVSSNIASIYGGNEEFDIVINQGNIGEDIDFSFESDKVFEKDTQIEFRFECKLPDWLSSTQNATFLNGGEFDGYIIFKKGTKSARLIIKKAYLSFDYDGDSIDMDEGGTSFATEGILYLFPDDKMTFIH